MKTKDPSYFRRERLLAKLGRQLKLARRRRNMTMETAADEASISRSTLWSVERGSTGVSLGVVLRILAVYGLEGDLLLVAGQDKAGRDLQDKALVPDRKKKKRSKGVTTT